MSMVRLTPPPADSPTPEERVRWTTIIRPEDPEAREWLRSDPGDAPLAANVFDAEGRARSSIRFTRPARGGW
jgi:hypothetical protein